MRRRVRFVRGQTMVELALVFPLFIVVVFGVISMGLAVFYQQQVTNAAREAARFAAVHSATAQCPTTSTKPPLPPPSDRYWDCDAPAEGWPEMTARGRSLIFGMPKNDVRIAACWAGYVDDATESYDAPPPGTYPRPDGSEWVVASTWTPCRIGGVDPLTNADAIQCTNTLAATTSDTASNLSEAPGRIVANQVTAVACYVWHPPLGGLGIPVPCPSGWCSIEIIPGEIVMHGVVSEPIQRQQ